MSKVRIGSIFYEVEIVKNLKNEEGLDLHGEIVYGEFKIRLGSKHTKESSFTTTWHEVLHGISSLYDLDLDEHTVMILGMTIAQILQDNPNMNWRKEK